jgi:fatty acid desaturase
VFWPSVIALVAFLGAWKQFALIWLLPYYIAGVIQTGRKFTEHLGMASYDPMLGTRTVMGRSWITRLATFMNFDIFVHGPHHRHPRVPHDKLKQRMREYLERTPDVPFPVFRSYAAAVRHMLPSLFRNPGVGMNAGAGPPGKEKRKPFDFVSDVTEEVLSDEDRRVPALAGTAAGESR